MANAEHEQLLQQGETIWNQWRKDHPDANPGEPAEPGDREER